MSAHTSIYSQAKRLLLIFLFIGPILACNFDSLNPVSPATPDTVGTQVAQTVAAQSTESGQEVTATPEGVVTSEVIEETVPADTGVIETQVAETAVSLASTTTSANHAQETRNAQVLATSQAAYVVPELRAILDAVNVRNGPGTEYRVISNLRINQTVPVIAKNRVGDWFVVELQGGSKGWVHDSVTDPVSAQAMAQIGVAVTIPPPPPPTATATYTPTPLPPTYTPTPIYTDGTLYANNTGFDSVCYLYISPSNNSDWGGDWLGSGVLDAGQTLAITVESGSYDLQAEDCNGNLATQYDVYISAGSYFDWNIYIEPPPEETTLTVSNWLDESVCYLYISPSDNSEWGGDWLGDGIIESYGSRIFYLNEGSYDLKATDCFDYDLDIEGPVYISGDSYWDIEN